MDLSIITVSYNAVDTIERTIQSVMRLRQQADVEYIVVDGKSTDGTLKVIDQYSKEIDQLVVEEDRGIYDAMNKGIRRATSDWIGVLNSDDWYHNDLLHSLRETIDERPQSDIVIGQLVLVSQDGTYGRIVDPPTLPFNCFKPNNHPATFVRRSAYEQIGHFDLRYPIAADLDFLLRVQSHPDITISRCLNPLTYMRMGGVSYGFRGMIESGRVEAKHHGWWSGVKVGTLKTVQKARRWLAHRLLPRSLFDRLRTWKWRREDGEDHLIDTTPGSSRSST